MGKNSRKDKEKDETSRGSQNQPKPTTPNQSTTPYPARRVHNDPKVAQQAPTGTVPHQKVGANSTSTTMTSNTPKSSGHHLTDQLSSDTNWPDFQLLIFKNTTHHQPITFHGLTNIKDKLINHTLTYFKANPSHYANIQTNGIYYNKILRCGIVNCKQDQALSCFASAIPNIWGSEFKGWTKDEQVTTYVKIFVPQGFEKAFCHRLPGRHPSHG